MKSKTIFKLLLLLTIVTLGACKEDAPQTPEPEPEPDPEPQTFYVQMGQGNPINSEFELDENSFEATYAVEVEGTDSPTEAITVSLTSDASLAEEYNTANETSYALLPAASFSMDASVTIAAGTSEVQAKVNISDKSLLDPYVTYLLAIRIDGVEGGETSTTGDLNAYFTFTASTDVLNLDPQNHEGWIVESFSSEEANGEGEDNGHAMHSIDDNNDTFWHSQWQNEEPAPPHWIVYNFGESKTVRGVYIQPRDHGTGQPAAFTIEVSTDGETWSEVETFDVLEAQFPTPKEPYKRALAAPIEGQYLRFTVTATMPWHDREMNSDGPNSTHLSEFSIL